MLENLAKAILGNANDRYLKKTRQLVAQINALESQIAALSDEALQAQTTKFRAQLAKGTKLDALLPEAFATVREASKRVFGMRHFDVQLIGGIVLHQGKIAEMKTGEGKTLMATLPAYLNALPGKGIHVITVNDYLAKRDALWMGKLYNFLGLSVGIIVHGLDDSERREQYAADITYGTNNEFGFDYLRDNMRFRLNDMCQRPFFYGIVDEVDSILIDEARTPLIISGAAQDSSELYVKINAIIPVLTADDHEKDEKQRSVMLTESGVEKLEAVLRERGVLEHGHLYDMHNINVNHHVMQALRAHVIFRRDTDYIVKDDKVIIIDEHTGRMRQSNRYSEGLHQALEAKEGVKIEQENQTLASITYQNYFRLFPKLSGMTGTAQTEAAEFMEIYGLEVVEIPTNVAVARKDNDDLIYRTEAEKFKALVKEIKEARDRGQPVLVGTTSIEKSEMLGKLMDSEKIPHSVLNARFHEQEAQIISQAGRPGTVTVATNMAGRGTDIKLGGNLDMMLEQALVSVEAENEQRKITDRMTEEYKTAQAKVLEAGGLFVLGTERHESRRIDNQLRGRSGRQGDPGTSRFFVSLEDDLMRIFGAEKFGEMLKSMGMKEGEALWHPWINRGILNAQRKVESHHFEIRKNLLKYDDVMNDQRKVIYEQRREIMGSDDIADIIDNMWREVIEEIVSEAIPANSYAEIWDAEKLHEECIRLFNLDLPIASWFAEEGIAEREVASRITAAAETYLTARMNEVPEEQRLSMQRNVLLQMLDQVWREHLLQMDYLRHGISLRAYGQKDPLNEYKRESFALFQIMLRQLREQVVQIISHAPISGGLPEGMRQVPPVENPALSNGLARSTINAVDANDQTTWANLPRNALCPCGSGKKYKYCHGAVAAA